MAVAGCIASWSPHITSVKVYMYKHQYKDLSPRIVNICAADMTDALILA